MTDGDRYIIIDDNNTMLEKQQSNLILVDFKFGFSIKKYFDSLNKLIA